ncbi:hypothetical protein KR51_00035630 [Rubidibacter lacunae KORDI 51-2]|uniref:Uncharacterized protein n=1 Tax=Rubidibacter lacunae KORDI 51-2 TaxID=582515 RepID=U5D5L6_9CHRO|nr:hypothetical protein [Rubidibacter lacunae]ERN39963.1 hypothetical protein KR51_00035630 [Rubidibacter lacunae KORDI 51-2]
MANWFRVTTLDVMAGGWFEAIAHRQHQVGVGRDTGWVGAAMGSIRIPPRRSRVLAARTRFQFDTVLAGSATETPASRGVRVLPSETSRSNCPAVTAIGLPLVPPSSDCARYDRWTMPNAVAFRQRA